MLVIFATSCGGGDNIAEPDDPTDLITDWPASCDQAFELVETALDSTQDSASVSAGILAVADPLFVECTTRVIEEYPTSCLDVVTTMSSMLEAQTRDPSTVVGLGAEMMLRRSDALIACDADHVYDAAPE